MEWRTEGLPFLTALVPSERFNQTQGRRHKTLLDLGRQLAVQARRWLPGRDLVFVADSSFSSLFFLHALQRRGLTVVTRLRLDAALYDPAPPRAPGTGGRPRKAGKRLATPATVAADPATVWKALRVEHWYGGGARDLQIASATAVWRHGGLPVVRLRWVLIRDPKKPDAPAQALLYADLDRTPEDIVAWFVRRWRIETTFQETRTRLGVETHRQWSDRAIARTTPCLLALFSIVTLLAARLPSRARRSADTAARHSKATPTFSDALAAVRRAIWRQQHFQTSPRQTDRRKIPFRLPQAWAYALCNAA